MNVLELQGLPEQAARDSELGGGDSALSLLALSRWASGGALITPAAVAQRRTGTPAPTR